MSKGLGLLRRWWFVASLFAVLLIGVGEPAPGRSLAGSVGGLIVAVLFLMSLTLPLSRLVAAARNGRALLVSFSVSYFVIPASCWAAARFLYPDPGLAAGFAILGAMPCTLASAAVWTRMARGNDAVPMVFTTLTNALTFLVVPALLWLTLSRWLPVDATGMAGRLLTRVLAPIAAGQLFRALFPTVAERAREATSLACRVLVLLIVVVAASGAADEFRTKPGETASIFVVTGLIHLAAIFLADRGARLLSVVPEDAVGVLFAASQKSLYVGVYVAAAFYPGHPAALLPILAFHVVQLVVDTILAEKIGARAVRSGAEVGESQPRKG